MIEIVQKEDQPENNIPFNRFPGGLHTSIPSEMISPEDLSECVDFKYNGRGDLEIRSPIVKYTSAACSSGTATCGHAIIDGTARTLVGDDNNNIYYLGSSGTLPIYIDTADGTPEFLPYNDVCLVLDGSYIKYLDGVTELKIAYDDSETFYDHYSDTQGGVTALTTAGVGCTFTTPAWDAGFTIPPTTVTAKVQNTTAGTGTISAVIWDITASSASSTTEYTGSIPSAAADFVEISVVAGDITNELDPETDYRCLLQGTNVNLSHAIVTSSGTLVTGGVTPDTTKDPIMKINPGRPPKASNGEVADNRPFTWGDPDDDRKASYGKLTHLEWGKLSAVDDDRNSFPIGGMVMLYGDLWAYGKRDQPYMGALEGDTESDWIFKGKFQESWTLPDTIENVGNDVFTASSDGVKSLTGVQEYGDVRTKSESDKISDRISDNWVSTAFSGYYPKDGQYWLYMPGYSKILICHTKHVGKPWTEYSPPMTPTYFKQCGENWLMCCGDKYLYTFSTTEYKDLTTTQISPSAAGVYMEFPFTANINQVQFIARSLGGARFNFDIYKNGDQDTSIHTWTHYLAISDALTVDELDMEVQDMYFAINHKSVPNRIDLNFTCDSFKWRISTVETAGYPIYYSGKFFKYEQEA